MLKTDRLAFTSFYSTKLNPFNHYLSKPTRNLPMRKMVDRLTFFYFQELGVSQLAAPDATVGWFGQELGYFYRNSLFRYETKYVSP